MKALLITFLLIICTNASIAQYWQWGESLGGTGYDAGATINTDNDGNLLITGVFADTAYFGTFSVVSSGGGDMFFAKLDSNGNVLWVEQLGGAQDDYGADMISDSSGNLYILGTFRGTITIDSITFISQGLKDFFLAKLDSNWNLLWAKSFGGTGGDDPFAIILDRFDNIYLITPFESTIVFDNDSLTSNGDRDIAIVKFNNNGDVLWAKQHGGPGRDIPVSIDLDTNGNLYVAGHFQDTVYFDSTILTSSGMWDVFIVKYDQFGNMFWAKKAGSTGDDGTPVVRIGTDNNLYLAGIFENTCYFDSMSITSMGSLDIFLAKYTVDGDVIWVKNAVSSNGLDFMSWDGMTLDQNCNIYFTGNYGSLATFDSFIVSGSDDIYVAKYDSTGSALWVQTASGPGGQGSQFPYGIAENKNSVYVVGSFRNDLSFDSSNVSLTSAGSDDIFIAKLSGYLTGISQLASFESVVNIYPNPVNSILTIELMNNNPIDNMQVTIFDIMGKELMPPIDINQKSELDVSWLPPGIYLIKLNLGNGTYHQRVIKV